MLSEREAELYRLRMEREEVARRNLEEENRRTQEGKFCATPFGVDVVGITETVALIGAIVGGTAAKRRKDEVDVLNAKLRQINLQLRQQARAGTLYAPGLTYAPPAEKAAAAAVVAPAPNTRVTPSGLMVSVSMEDDEMNADQLALRDTLKAGKRLLKEKKGAEALALFEKAQGMARALKDKVQERRAYRGLAAACRLNKQLPAAIKHLERVLDISKEINEYTGDADAFGTIADCYTDMGDLEKAAQFYDKYIGAMDSTDGLSRGKI